MNLPIRFWKGAPLCKAFAVALLLVSLAGAAPMSVGIEGSFTDQSFRIVYGNGYYDDIIVSATVSLTVLPSAPVGNASDFTSGAAQVTGTIHVWGTAKRYNPSLSNTHIFDNTYNYNQTPGTVAAHYEGQTGNGSVTDLVWQIAAPGSVDPSKAVPYRLHYYPALLRLWIALPSPFRYNEVDEYYDTGAAAVVVGQESVPSCLLGTVTNGATGQAVSGAQVRFGNVAQTADSGGNYFYGGIPPNTYQLIASDPALCPVSEIVTVPAFRILRHDVVLNSVRLRVLDANPRFMEETEVPVTSLSPGIIEALARASTERARATADGATQLLLRCEAPVPGKVTFAQNGPAEGRLESLVLDQLLASQTTTSVNGKHMAFARYVVPEHIPFLDPDPVPPPVDFTATFVPDALPAEIREVSAAITLVPTPILMVHGLWGADADWADLGVDLWFSAAPRGMCWRAVDYSPSNAAPLAENTNVIPQNAEELLTMSRERPGGCASTRVDVVAHSMGGALTRIAANLNGYKARANFGKGYIRRFISVDTPHFGATSAEFLLRYLAAFTNPQDRDWRIGHMEDQGKFAFRGAVEDFSPFNFAHSVGGLSGYVGREVEVPSHPIACWFTGDSDDVDPCWETLVTFLWKWDLYSGFGALGQQNPGLATLSYNFDFEYFSLFEPDVLTLSSTDFRLWATEFSLATPKQNDGTVALDSQLGGMHGVQQTTFRGVSHVRAPHNAGVRAEILRLLSDPKGANFGPLPAVSEPNVNAQKAWYAAVRGAGGGAGQRPAGGAGQGPVEAPRAAVDPGFCFSSPLEGSVVRAGQAVPFELALDTQRQWSGGVVAWSGSGEAAVPQYLSAQPFAGTFTCPANALGRGELAAWGLTQDGDVRIARVSFTVVPPDGVTLSSMTVGTSAILLEGRGETAGIRVKGLFSDGQSRDLRDVSTATSYLLGDTSLATIDSVGRVTAVAEGETWIDVQNRGLSSRVGLKIAFEPPSVLAVFSGPIPGNAGTVAKLRISGMHLGGATGVEIWHNGQIADAATLTNPTTTGSGGLITADLTLRSGVEPGQYSVVVATPTGRSDVADTRGAVFTIGDPLTLEAVATADQTIALRLTGPLAAGFVIESSSDLLTWTVFATGTATGATWTSAPISTSGYPKRFFRARLAE